MNSINIPLEPIGKRTLIACYCSMATDESSGNTMRRTPEKDFRTVG
jgi:hypothetical protein